VEAPVAIPQAVLDDIRAKIPLSSLVRKKVKLQKAGKEFKGLSPFNQEKTPSFFVNDVKQFYHCFSSGKNGDCFSWLQETEGLTFIEAVERLADEAGVPLPTRGPEEEAEYRENQILHMNMREDCLDYQLELSHTPSGALAAAELYKRGLTNETIMEFGIGYASNGRFHNRITFPIQNPQGRIVAFSGRALGDAQPKYLNSPESPIFIKGKTLYNFHRAREAAREFGTITVVEGQMDVISMWQAGYKNVVAPLGTALTVEQLELLWSVVNEPIICFDGDMAGLRATNRAIDLALKNMRGEKSLRIALLPPGHDPDSWLRENPKNMKLEISDAMALSVALWDRETSGGINTPEKRSAALNRLLEAVRAIPDSRVSRMWREIMLNRMRTVGDLKPWKPKVNLPPAPSDTKKQRLIACIAAARPDLVDQNADALATIKFTDAESKLVINGVLVGSEPSVSGVLEALWGVDRASLYNRLLADPHHPSVDESFRELLGLPLEAEP
jgi:DNA primase